MNKDEILILLSTISEAAVEAGKEILKVYDSDFSVENKKDESPLTLADKNAHLKIVEILKQTNLPILSEEGRDISFEERKNWEYFWMVDPLDGTKEFVKRNGEFTVNIALINQEKAILGVIYVPVTGVLYLGAEKVGAYKIKNFNEQDITHHMSQENRLPLKINRKYTLVGSRSHMSVETEEYFNEKKKEQGEVDIISKGSSLKLCMVAEGMADDYPRFAPTMEWDTAAGQAIVEASGGSVINWNTKSRLNYNKENLLNDWFLVTIRN